MTAHSDPSPDVCRCKLCEWLREFKRVTTEAFLNVDTIQLVLTGVLVEKGIVTQAEMDEALAGGYGSGFRNSTWNMHSA